MGFLRFCYVGEFASIKLGGKRVDIKASSDLVVNGWIVSVLLVTQSR